MDRELASKHLCPGQPRLDNTFADPSTAVSRRIIKRGEEGEEMIASCKNLIEKRSLFLRATNIVVLLS